MPALLLSNPNEIPYGNLSPLKNNLVSECYTALIKTTKESLIKEIKNSPADIAKEKSLNEFTIQQNELYTIALKHAMDIKYKNIESQQALLSITQKNIYFVCEPVDTFLGVEIIKNKDGSFEYKGNNIIGKYLVEIRKRLQLQNIENINKEKRKYINEIYSVYKALKDDIVSGQNDLSLYLNKSVDDILKMRYIELNPIEIINITDLMGLNKVHYKDINFFLHFPTSIASILRSQHYREYNNICEQLNKDQITAYYIENLIKQHIGLDKKSNLTPEQWKMFRKLLQELTEKNQLEPLQNRLIALHKMGKFSDFTFNYLDIVEPSNEMYNRYLHSEKLADFVKPDITYEDTMLQNIFPKKEVTIQYTSDSIIRNDSIHSPYFFQFIKINCNDFDKEAIFYYPTIIHYVYASLYQSLDMSCNKAHNMLKNNPESLSLDPYSYLNTDQLKILYEKERYEYIYKKVSERARLLLNKLYSINTLKNLFDYNNDSKTKNKKSLPELTYIQQLLISTNKDFNTIIFNSQTDFRLGNAKDREGKVGKDFIGKYLTEIRKTLVSVYGYHPLPETKTKIIKKQEQQKTIIEILPIEEKRVFAIQRTKDLYDMVILFQKLIKADPSFRKVKGKSSNEFTLNESYHFIFKNFFDCIQQINIPDFNKYNIPSDLKKMFDNDIDSLVLANLWEYMFYNYAAFIKIESNKNSFKKLLTFQRDYTSELALKNIQLSKDDLFNSFSSKNLMIKGNDIIPSSFPDYIIEQSKVMNFPIDYSKFITTGEESYYSSLLPRDVNQVERILHEWFGNNVNTTIIDATAHIGVDSIHFSMLFPNAMIHSYEINDKTYQLLKQNIETFNVSKQIIPHHINFIKADLPKEDISFIYIDAPWRGKEYTKTAINEYELYLDDINIKEVAKRLLVNNITNVVVIKVPYNYHISDLKETFNVERKDVINNKGKISYVLLKLTILQETINKCLVKTLAINAFSSIFESLNAFKQPFIVKIDKQEHVYRESFFIDKDAIHLAFRFLYLSDKTITFNEKEDTMKPSSSVYETIILPYLAKWNETSNEWEFNIKLDIAESFKRVSILSYMIEKCVKTIYESINYININDVVSRLLLFSNSKLFSFEKIINITYENKMEEKVDQYIEYENEENEENGGDEDEDSENDGYGDLPENFDEEHDYDNFGENEEHDESGFHD